MKKILLAGMAGASLIAIAPANAADHGPRRPVYQAPPAMVPAPVFSWTGRYLGGNIGGGFGRKTVTAPEIAPGVSFTGDTVGVVGGGQVGCNHQVAPNWAIGIEGDGEAANIKGDATTTVLGITGTAQA